MCIIIDIHLAVVGSHAAHTSAKLAMEGEYTEARVNAFSKQRLLQRTRYVTVTIQLFGLTTSLINVISSHFNPENRVQYTNLMVDLIPMESALQRKQTVSIIF
jgi:hypothetical protein